MSVPFLNQVRVPRAVQSLLQHEKSVPEGTLLLWSKYKPLIFLYAC